MLHYAPTKEDTMAIKRSAAFPCAVHTSRISEMTCGHHKPNTDTQTAPPNAPLFTITFAINGITDTRAVFASA